MTNIVQVNLEGFGFRELDIASRLLAKVSEYGYPRDFSDAGISLAFNTHSGYVFLTNEDYQVLMLENDKLTIIENDLKEVA
jgi:hypothetical protein